MAVHQPNKDWSRKQLALWIIMIGIVVGILLTTVHQFSMEYWCKRLSETCPKSHNCNCYIGPMPIIAIAIGIVISTSIMLLMERVAPKALDRLQ